MALTPVTLSFTIIQSRSILSIPQGNMGPRANRPVHKPCRGSVSPQTDLGRPPLPVPARGQRLPRERNKEKTEQGRSEACERCVRAVARGTAPPSSPASRLNRPGGGFARSTCFQGVGSCTPGRDPEQGCCHQASQSNTAVVRNRCGAGETGTVTLR